MNVNFFLLLKDNDIRCIKQPTNHEIFNVELLEPIKSFFKKVFKINLFLVQKCVSNPPASIQCLFLSGLTEVFLRTAVLFR